jgi:hypothetical protein
MRSQSHGQCLGTGESHCTGCLWSVSFRLRGARAGGRTILAEVLLQRGIIRFKRGRSEVLVVQSPFPETCVVV